MRALYAGILSVLFAGALAYLTFCFTKRREIRENYMILGPEYELNRAFNQSGGDIYSLPFTESSWQKLYRIIYGIAPPYYENGVAFHVPGVARSTVPQVIDKNDMLDMFIPVN